MRTLGPEREAIPGTDGPAPGVRSVPFHLVDVFADRPLHGNPVALLSDAEDVDEPTMRAIAREFNQSETVFLLPPTVEGATVRLRSFTPAGAEVFGAGHNALGAWLWLAEAGRIPIGASPGSLAQEIAGELLPVDIARLDEGPTVVSMTQSAPQFGSSVADRGGLAESLGVAEEDIAEGEPARVVSTGAGHLLVPLVDRSAVDRAAPDAKRLTAVLGEVGGQGCYLYSLDPPEASGAIAYTRFFNPIMGISEDPATGSAAGPLAAQLVRAGHAADDSTVIIEQGRALGRPSRIRVTISGADVRVSGSGLVVAEGSLLL